MDDSDGLAQLTEMHTVCQRGAYLHIALCTEVVMHVLLALFKKLMNHKLFNHGVHRNGPAQPNRPRVQFLSARSADGKSAPT